MAAIVNRLRKQGLIEQEDTLGNCALMRVQSDNGLGVSPEMARGPGGAERAAAGRKDATVLNRVLCQGPACMKYP